MRELELSKKGKKNKGKYKALVDDDIFDIVNSYSWTYLNTGYARNIKMNIQLHVFIWNLKFGDIPDGYEIEHWDENGLNCQISNLRLATRSENQCNITKQKNNKSGYKGICKKIVKGHPRKDGTYKIYTKWYAGIIKDYGKKTEKRYAKTFDYTDKGLQEAIEWYKEKSLELQGKFSIFNKPKK